MVYVGQEKYLGVYYKAFSITEDFEYGPGAVSEVFYFQFKVDNRTYNLSIRISAIFENNPSGNDQYAWDSYEDPEIYNYLANMEEQVFDWVKTIELV